MDFLNRIKKEMSEGIVRAILEDGGYRVIDTGIEKVIRELSCLTASRYLDLQFPQAMRHLPDFTVMDESQTLHVLVDVKFRQEWDPLFLLELKEQVEHFQKITAVVIVGRPPNPSGNAYQHFAKAYIRCIDLKFENEVLSANWRNKDGTDRWVIANEQNLKPMPWWATRPQSEKFPGKNSEVQDQALRLAVNSISGIVDTTDMNQPRNPS